MLVRDLSTSFRTALLVLCAALSAVATARTYAAVPVALLAAGTFAAARSRTVAAHPQALAVAEALAAAVAVVGTGGATSPMLPYLLAAPTCVALVRGPRSVVVTSLAAAAGLAAALPVHPTADLGAALTAGVEWVLLGLALGLLTDRVVAAAVPPAAEDGDRYAEAHALLEQLRGVSRGLPGGLDVGASADALLTACAEVTTAHRCAVLVQPAPGSLFPAAVRGAKRVPWRTPLDEPGPLRDAWESGGPVVDRREPDADGRRRGSALLVLPLQTAGSPFGLVVLESFDVEAYGPADVAALVAAVQAGTLRLETALLFAEVHSAVTVEERGRLAREIHDGIAQELASVGYRLDDLRLQSAKHDAGLADQVREVRGGLTGLISDLRLSITDLRSSVASDRGLGAALSGYVRAVGSGQRLRVHLTLQESAFRLPAEQEVLLFQITQAIANETRKCPSAGNLWVDLAVDPPYARLVVEHDGLPESLPDLAGLAGQLLAHAGRLVVDDRPDGGVRVHVELEGGSDDDQRPARR